MFKKIFNTENALLVFCGTTGYFGIEFLRNYHDILTIRGQSMAPTLYDGDKVYCQKFCNDGFTEGFSYPNLKHGDIVYFRNPLKPDQMDVKRVIAMGKDVVTPVRNTLKADKDPVPIRVKPGYVFLEADNMYQYYRQEDSNRFGVVPAGLIHGIVRVKLCDKHHNWEYVDFEEDRAIPKERVQIHEWKKEVVPSLKDMKHDDMLGK